MVESRSSPKKASHSEIQQSDSWAVIAKYFEDKGHFFYLFK